MSKVNTNLVNWVVVCINEFARLKKLSPKAAFHYLYTFGGIEFMKVHYEAEHLLSLNDAIEDLSIVCINNGGTV